jgi:hypothetical protein
VASAPLLDRLHELIAVARLLGEEEEEPGADVAPAPAPAAPTAAWPKAGTRSEGRSAGTEGVAFMSFKVSVASHWLSLS